MGFFLKKEDFREFLASLMKEYSVIAPIKSDIVRFQKISAKDIQKIDFSANTRLSPVKHIFNQKEIIGEIKDGKLLPSNFSIKPQIIFGIRNCDSNALNTLDKVFYWDFEDPMYKAKRDKTLIFQLACEKPMDNCFCDSMNLKDIFDLRFFKTKDGFIVEAGSAKGKKLIDDSELFEKTKEAIPARQKCALSLDNKDISKKYDANEWEKDAARCFSCSACNMLCPTCSCFDVKDIINPDLKSGKRIKIQDACHNQDFTRVAGDFVFRNKRSDRFKHRIYHKLVYFPQRFNEYMCTGCGRCIAQCPSKINWVETANKLK